MASSASAASFLGLTGAAWLSGTISALSLVSIPAITLSMSENNLSPSHAAKLWRLNFQAGFKLAPPIAVATASSLVFAGWRAVNSARAGSRKGVKDGRLFFVAAALTVAIVPFTILLMSRTNNRLLGLAGKEALSGAEGEEVRQLLGRWTTLNGVRGLLPLAGAVLTGILVLG